MEQIFECKNVQIKNIQENSVKLFLNVSFVSGKIQQVELGLNKKEMNKNNLIDNLVKKGNTLEGRNIELKNKINKLEENHIELKNKLNKLEEENKNLTKEINEIKEKQINFEILFEHEIRSKRKLKNLRIDSKIIINKKDLNFLFDD